MSFRPLDAIVELDRKLTPGPIGGLYVRHYETVRQRAASLPTDALILEIARYKKAEQSRVAIALLAVFDVVGAAAVLGHATPLLKPRLVHHSLHWVRSLLVLIEEPSNFMNALSLKKSSIGYARPMP